MPLKAPDRFRVLLVNPNRYDQPYPVYPVGIAYIEGALRSAGHMTRIWDARISGASLESFISEFAPGMVGVSVRNIDNVQAHNPRSFVRDLVDVCGRVRAATSVPLVLGGSGFSMFPRELCALTRADYGVEGEGEAAMLHLVECVRQTAIPGPMPGVWRRGGDVLLEPPRELPTSPVFGGSPHHDSGLLGAYVAQGSLPGVQTQRGCPLRCCYCTYPLIEGTRSRFRSGEETAEEFRRLSAQGVRYVFIVDSVFNTRLEHVADTCEALIRANVGVNWECFLRPRGITREMLELMRRAGLRHIEFGSDSLTDEVLEHYGKSFRFEDVRSASVLAHQLGLRYSHFIIFGGPGENAASVEKTIAHSASLPGAYFFGTIGMRVYPNTPLWSRIASDGNRASSTDSSLLEPQFHLEPPLTVDWLVARLNELRRSTPNWAVGDPPPIFIETMAKLRRRGVWGPMWEYAELLQRFQSNDLPSGTPAVDRAGFCATSDPSCRLTFNAAQKQPTLGAAQRSAP